MHQVRNLVLNDAQGAVEGMVLVLLDVTERYSAESVSSAPSTPIPRRR